MTDVSRERIEEALERLRGLAADKLLYGLQTSRQASRDVELIAAALREAQAENERLREATEALVDVMPYLHPNPNSPNAEKWQAWKDEAEDKAAAALRWVATRERGERVKPGKAGGGKP